MQHDTRYDAIVDRPHPDPQTHARMPRQERAAQFSAFAALAGYDDAVRETARLTGSRIELDEGAADRLNGAFLQLQEHPGAAVRVTYFAADGRKAGGEYVTADGVFRRLDEEKRLLAFADGDTVPLDDILMLEAVDDEGDV